MTYLNQKFIPIIQQIELEPKEPSPIYYYLGYSAKFSKQSFSIAMGHQLEKFWNIVVSDFAKNNIASNNKNISESQIDMCFEDDHGFIYYREIKCNLNLDSEKKKASNQKVNRLKEDIKNKYNLNEVDVGYFVPFPLTAKNKTSATNIINKGINVNGVEWIFDKLPKIPFTLDEYLNCYKEHGDKQYRLFFN